MMTRWYKLIALVVLLVAGGATAFAQYGPDKRGIRSGNRAFDKKKWQLADIQYRRALLADSTSFAGNYNLAGALYREEDYEGAAKSLDKVKEQVKGSPYAADYWFNAGDAALQKKDWKAAVDAFRESLLLRPDDLDAKENYIYARKMLQDQQNQQNQQNQDQNQDQQDQDQNQDQQNQDQNKDQQDQNQDQQEQPSLSPQQAQQMLQAIQAREKETQDKVNKEKAAALRARQKDKNW